MRKARRPVTEVRRHRIAKRIGAYGGTFDPVHNGHLEVALAVTNSFKLDRLFLIPSARPPHKQRVAVSDRYHRYVMTVLATLESPSIYASTAEIEAPDEPYTFQTVGHLRSVYGADAMLFFIMGSDSFFEFDTWMSPDRILAESNLIVAARPAFSINRVQQDNIVDLRGLKRDVDPSLMARSGRIYLTDYVSNEISATGIRRRLSEGLSIKGLVPDRVADYIYKYELYKVSA